jgi:hypothetical protein
VAILHPELIDAVGNLLQADPARIVALASSLRAPNRSIESTVQGMSMGRGLPPGSRIRIELIERARYDTGEVIAFLSDGQVIVHRVVHRGRIGMAANHVLTRGDATLVPDPPVEHARILGPVTGVRREARWRDLSGPPRRSLRARVASSLLLIAATGSLYLSPRATAGMLIVLNRAARALRVALARRFRPHAPVPPETP